MNFKVSFINSEIKQKVCDHKKWWNLKLEIFENDVYVCNKKM